MDERTAERAKKTKGQKSARQTEQQTAAAESDESAEGKVTADSLSPLRCYRCQRRLCHCAAASDRATAFEFAGRSLAPALALGWCVAVASLQPSFNPSLSLFLSLSRRHVTRLEQQARRC